MSHYASSQHTPVVIEKVSCFHWADRFDGYHLVINVRYNDTIIKTPRDYYYLDAVIKLPDSIKLMVVEKLLKFKGDTSLCCRKVRGYHNEGIGSLCTVYPKTTLYSIQIEALFMINKIVRPYGTSLYSCFPVVVDRITNEEINSRHDLIREYFNVYEKCFGEAVKQKVIGETFKFNTKKYIWFGAVSDTME